MAQNLRSFGFLNMKTFYDSMASPMNFLMLKYRPFSVQPRISI